jgi:ABC-2 type transport system permease protein
MNKIWLIFKHEYTRHVMRKRFIITVFSMPLFIGVMMVASIASSMMSINRSPVGYVNQSDVLNGFTPEPPKKEFLQTEVEFIEFDSESKAEIALENKSIQAYFVLDTDNNETINAQLVYYKFPANTIQEQFSDQVKQYLIKSQPAAVVTRLTEGFHMTLLSADGSRKMGENDWINYVVLFGTGILFIVVLFTSSGYLMSALVEEKENRTMEILITSVSPDQLMAGKVLGNLSVGLTQMSVWVITLILGYLIGKSQFNWLQNLHISPGEILTLAAIMLVDSAQNSFYLPRLQQAGGSSPQVDGHYRLVHFSLAQLQLFDHAAGVVLQYDWIPQGQRVEVTVITLMPTKRDMDIDADGLQITCQCLSP